METLRRSAALLLVPTLVLIGVPIAGHAEGSPPLTINGRPLRLVLNRAALGDPIPLAGLLGQATGQISGVALDGEGQPLAEHTVRATRLFTLGGSPAEQVMGTATTDAEGRFAFTGLEPSDYRVDVLEGDEVIAGTSVSLVEGTMNAGGVTVSVPPEGRNMGKWIGIGAGAAAGAFIIWAVAERCRNEGC